MAWRFDNPLVTLTDDKMNEAAKALWNREPLGGITEDNNRVPRPVVWLLGLTIISSFLMTFPLWGQRPQAAIYEEYVALMDSPEVQAAKDDVAKMDYIVKTVKAKGSKYEALQDRHPVEWADLKMIKQQIVELKNGNKPLEEYTIVGDRVVLANFEGNWKEDGTRERKQPWWDKGYTIDVFYVIYFCISVVVVIKRLPPNSWQPTHAGH